MKISKMFIVVIILFMIVLVFVELKMPRKYEWRPNYEHYNTQPFGCLVMDSMMSASTGGRYSASGKSLAQLKNDSSRENIIIVTASLDFDSLEYNSIDTLLMRGNSVLIATQEARYLADELLGRYDIHINSDWPYSYYTDGRFTYDLKEYLKNENEPKATLKWTGKGFNGAQKEFAVERGISDNFIRSFSYYDSSNDEYYEEDVAVAEPPGDVEDVKNEDYNRETLIVLNESDSHDEGYICAVRVTDKRYKGRLIVVANSLWFTNYGFTHDGSRQLAMRCISMLGDGPVIRLDTSLQDGKAYEESESPLRFLIKHRALRWALYLILLGIVLSMIFNCRRRQRVIPVLKKPENMAVKLIKHLGMLAYKKRDTGGLIESRYQMFEYEIRKRLLVDLNGDKEHAYSTIACATGLSEESVRSDLDDLMHVMALISMSQDIDTGTMKRVVGTMDNILSKIEIR